MNMTQGIIYYAGKERIGRLYMSRYCFDRMQQYKLTPELLTEVFRYGREVIPGQLQYADGDKLIGVFYAKDETKLFRGNLEDEWFVLITCWVRRAR
jgi:hypothetical protein